MAVFKVIFPHWAGRSLDIASAETDGVKAPGRVEIQRNKMKKILLFLFVIPFTTDVYATGIGANDSTASCDNDTLGQTSGTANVEVDWQPNTIGITWYNDDTQITVQSSAQSCVYDDDLYLPTAPTKTGYTFKGWTVQPRMDFATLNLYNGIDGYGKANNNICGYYDGSFHIDQQVCNEHEIFSQLQFSEWAVKYNHGILQGIAQCSTTSGTWGQPGNPISETGRYCWCKATSYKEANTNKTSKSLYTLPIILSSAHNANYCEQDCPVYCAYNVWNSPTFRSALTTPVSN